MSKSSLAVTQPAQVGARALASATISTALLLPHERIARTSLVRWAERLDARLTQCLQTLRKLPDFTATVADIANNAALVATYQGRPAMARVLCERQIQWQWRVARRARNPAGLPRALQPWINLGRLDALSGAWEAALNRFARLRELRDGSQVDLGPMCIHLGQCGSLSSTAEGLRQHLSTVYVVDSLRALLQNRRFSEAAEFASHLEPNCPSEPARLAVEASIVAACRLGDHRRAEDLAVRALDSARGWDRAVFRLRLVEVLACAGERSRAAEILSRTATVLRQVSTERKQDPNLLPVLVRYAAAAAELQLHMEGLTLASDARDAARAAGDEALEIESLRILVGHSPALQEWEEALSRLKADTDYYQYRVGRTISGTPALQSLYDRLLQFLGN